MWTPLPLQSRLLALYGLAALSACGDDSAFIYADTGADMALVDVDAPEMGTSDTGDIEADGRDAAVDADAIRVASLGEGIEVIDGRMHRYELIEVTHEATGQRTYLQWNEPDGGYQPDMPIMALTKPYVGIDWTGQEVDERWAARGEGFYPDEDSPGFEPASSSGIVYTPVTVRQMVEDGMIYLVNGVATLQVFGRFYVGGDVRDDINDMANGMRYLASRDELAHDRIGVFGGSWGGFEALYLATEAPASVRPRVGVALYPASDFEQLWRWAVAAESLPPGTVRDTHVAFFQPYLRRIRASTGGGPDEADFSGLTHDYFDEHLSTPIFTFHDDHDMLVPFSSAQDLATHPGIISTWFRHAEPVARDSEESLMMAHGDAVAAHLPDVYSMLPIALLSRLKDEGPLYTLATRDSFEATLAFYRAQWDRGQGVGALFDLLADMADARVQVLDIDASMFVPGASFVADVFNNTWDTSYDAANVQEALRTME